MATKQVSAPPPEPEETEPVDPPPPPEEAPAVGPLDAFQFDQSATWNAEYRSMLDAPGHPLGHLKGA